MILPFYNDNTGLINIGAYKFTPEIYNAINNISLSKRKELEITDALTLLAKNKKVKKIDDYWINFSSPGDVKTAEEFVRKEFD